MRKILSIVLVLVMVLAFVGCGKKNIEKISSLETIITMDEGDINSVLPGYTIDQLKEAWGTPSDSDKEKSVWYLNDMKLIAYNNWLGEIVVCGLEKIEPAKTEASAAQVEAQKSKTETLSETN